MIKNENYRSPWLCTGGHILSHCAVLLLLFKDQLAKIGIAERDVKTVRYDTQNGLVLTDQHEIEWNMEVKFSVKIPSNILEKTDQTVCTTSNLCDVCKYYEKIIGFPI